MAWNTTGLWPLPGRHRVLRNVFTTSWRPQESFRYFGALLRGGGGVAVQDLHAMFLEVVGGAGPRTAEFSTPDGGSGRYRKILRLCAGDP